MRAKWVSYKFGHLLVQGNILDLLVLFLFEDRMVQGIFNVPNTPG